MKYDTKRLSDMMVAAYAHQKNQQLSKALDSWNQILNMDNLPQQISAQTLLNIANLHHQQGSDELSLEFVKQAIASNPQNAEAHFCLGYFYQENDQWHQAIASFKTALKLNHNDAAAHNNLANCYDRIGDYKNALTAYNQALLLDNQYIGAIYNRANIYAKLNKIKNAIEDLNSAIKLDKNFYQAYYNRAMLHQRLGNQQLADKDFNQAKKIAQRDLQNKRQTMNNK